MKTQFDGYYWRPAEFSALCDTKKLSRSARAFYRELVDISWAGEAPGTIVMDHGKLAEQTGWPLKVVRQCMTELDDEVFLLLGLEPIWSRPCYHLSVIRDQAGEYQRSLDKAARDRLRATAQQEAVLRPATRPLAEERLPFITIPVGERSLTSYVGWLPTATFNSRGQVIPVDEALVNALYEAHPGVDVRSEITRMFDWLRANPARRPALTTMSKFMTSWLTKAGVTQQESTPSNTNLLNMVDEVLLGAAS